MYYVCVCVYRYAGWEEMSQACSRFGLTPKLLLYESVADAENVVFLQAEEIERETGGCRMM